MKHRGIADAFREARKRIKSRQNTYICFALSDTGHPYAVSASRIVQTRMSGHFTLEGWLLGNGHIPNKHMARKHMREYRLRWLDELITEFEEI
jgi:hypothetical protein